MPSRINPSAGSRARPLARALDRVHAYLLERQSPAGGFCFYRGYYAEEPNLADTWHALATLIGLLGVMLPDKDKHAAFVIEQPVDPQPVTLHARVRALQTLGIDDPHSVEVADAVASLPVKSIDHAMQISLEAALRRLRCTLWLKRHVGQVVAIDALAQALLRIEHTDGGYGTPPNLIDTEAVIAVLALCGHRVPTERTGAFVQRMAIPGFGFRLTADSLSPHLETTCAGIFACCRLGLPVPHAEDAMTFILSCQAGNGGFARAADALPDLSLTHLALAALSAQVAPQSLRDVASGYLAATGEPG